MKNAILKVLQESQGKVIFPELIEKIPGFAGDFEMRISNGQTLLWNSLSREAIYALTELIEEEKIEVSTGKGVRMLYNLKSPVVFTLPIATPRREYSKLHWLPMSFNLIAA